MANSVKVEMVEELHGMFSRAKSAVVANHQGIDAEGIAALRVHMRSRSVDFRVVKNTLARRAVKDTSLEVLSEDFKGPISILVGFEDAVLLLKRWLILPSRSPLNPQKLSVGWLRGKRSLQGRFKPLQNYLHEKN